MQFRQLVRYAEVLFVEPQHLLGGFEGELCLDGALGARTIGRVKLGLSVFVAVLCEPSDSEIEEIGRHFRSLLESYGLLPSLLLLRLDGHVGDYLQIRIDAD